MAVEANPRGDPRPPGSVLSASSDRSVCRCCRNRRSPSRLRLFHRYPNHRHHRGCRNRCRLSPSRPNLSRRSRNQCLCGVGGPPSLGPNLSRGRHHCQSQSLGSRFHRNLARYRILGGRVLHGSNHPWSGRREHPDGLARDLRSEHRPRSRRRDPTRRSGCSARPPSDRAPVRAPSDRRPSARLRSPSGRRTQPHRPTSDRNPGEPPRPRRRDDRSRPRPAGPASRAQRRRGPRRSQATPRTHRWVL